LLTDADSINELLGYIESDSIQNYDESFIKMVITKACKIEQAAQIKDHLFNLFSAKKINDVLLLVPIIAELPAESTNDIILKIFMNGGVKVQTEEQNDFEISVEKLAGHIFNKGLKDCVYELLNLDIGENTELLQKQILLCDTLLIKFNYDDALIEVFHQLI
jgi:hypothetical protein